MIYLIITTSINNKFGEQHTIHRQNRYVECITHLLDLIKNDPTIKPIIVENNGLRPTFLDDLPCDICYTNNNIDSIHKGVNELLDIKEVIHRHNIKDDDMIIKLTGRYKLLNLNFINLLKTNDHEAFVKFFNVATEEFLFYESVLGLFAIKCKYLKAFNYECLSSPEVEFATFVRKNIHRVLEVHQLDLECCFANNLKMLLV